MMSPQVQELAAAGHDVAYTFCTADPGLRVGTAHRVELAGGAGLAECLAAARPDAVVHSAAVSQPGVCAADPAAAMAVNVPTALLDALAVAAPSALFVLISTDQVYDGTRAFNVEEDAVRGQPANAYGASKRAAEAAVAARWPRHAVLRPSAIVGPPPPGAPVSRPLFLQWLDGALAGGTPTEMFEDEFRSVVYVGDVCAAVAALLRLQAAGRDPPHRVINLGGPERRVARAAT